MYCVVLSACWCSARVNVSDCDRTVYWVSFCRFILTKKIQVIERCDEFQVWFVHVTSTIRIPIPIRVRYPHNVWLIEFPAINWLFDWSLCTSCTRSGARLLAMLLITYLLKFYCRSHKILRCEWINKQMSVQVLGCVNDDFNSQPTS